MDDTFNVRHALEQTVEVLQAPTNAARFKLRISTDRNASRGRWNLERMHVRSDELVQASQRVSRLLHLVGADACTGQPSFCQRCTSCVHLLALHDDGLLLPAQPSDVTSVTVLLLIEFLDCSGTVDCSTAFC